MKWTKRALPAVIGLLLNVGLSAHSPAIAEDWRKTYAEITLGVITAENEADRVTRYKPVRDYLQRVLGVEIKWRTATEWNSDEYSNPKRMEMKGIIPPGQWRIIWQSPRLPSSPWAMPTYLPEQMRQDITEALLRMPQAAPDAWEALSMGKLKDFRVTHADYEPIVRMIQHSLEKRRTN